MQFKLTKPRPSPPHSLLSYLACAAATAASSLPSVSGFACRCQALKLNTFLWLIRSVERGKQKSFCYFCCYCCVKRFSVAYFCAPGAQVVAFLASFCHIPPISLRLHNFPRIFAGFYFAWFTLIFQPPSPDLLPSSLSLLFTSNVTHSSSRLSLSLTLFACPSVCVWECECVCVCKCTLAVLPAFVVLSHTWPINQTCVNVFTLYAHSYISNIFAAFYA